jgi:hypothetical protein
MTLLSPNPTDQNLLQSSKFTLNFDRLPYVQFFCQEITLPGMSVDAATLPTMFRNAPRAGNKIIYDPLVAEFVIDEQLLSWLSVRNWLNGIAFPESFEQYKNLSMQARIQMGAAQPQYSDASLSIMSNKNNPIITFAFTDVFPISLSGIKLNVKDSALNVLTATAEFQFTEYNVKRIG